jgi:hypothetical protein
LIIADFHLFGVALLLDPQGFDPVASGDFHLPQRDLGISMCSWVAVEPSGTGPPSMLGTPKPFWAEPSSRASVSGAPHYHEKGYSPHRALYNMFLNVHGGKDLIFRG